ncbi:hypothetical protein A0H81_01482 [Grifola frondosa]|uniref:Uncharacterized protein n=1 Tax=Grifola frondosa TaxID=5627 RepID=A0A1C7MPZ3_GRIFR|nr:hypothetical protein A0H81_01482 [Grifola frondosa]
MPRPYCLARVPMMGYQHEEPPAHPAPLPPIAGSSSSSSMSMDDTPVKMPRILTLVAESHLQDDEVKSEAQFQRMVASFSESPTRPRTPRAPSDRGRHPEETGGDESQREDTPSDDDDLDLDDAVPFAYVDPLYKPITPAQSVNGDEMSMMESPGMAMDVDLPSSMMSSPIVSSWRYTPPPTSSAVRNNKRKFDDRYDPYPNASKRRAVSLLIDTSRPSRKSRPSTIRLAHLKRHPSAHDAYSYPDREQWC